MSSRGCNPWTKAPRPAFGTPLPRGREEGKGARGRRFRGRCPRLLISSPCGAEASSSIAPTSRAGPERNEGSARADLKVSSTGKRNFRTHHFRYSAPALRDNCMNLTRRWVLVATFVVACIGVASALRAATVSPLFARGYTVLPEPQKAELSGPDFEFRNSWRLQLASGVKADDIAVRSLKQELLERDHIALREASGKGGAVLTLAVDPRAVEIGVAIDREKVKLAEQAYRIKLAPSEITITGDSSTGLSTECKRWCNY